MGSLSIWHWLILALVIVLIFGTSKLKNAGKDLGSAIHDFKKGLNGEEEPKNKKEDTTQKIKDDSQ
ncbi:Sec-independent protein translocase subunit TatA [Neisseriaceae bacterium PsAf]|nr:Sec-independent protein translocase subunit TatA [Neisseriaceae bacterium PsAf]MCV2503469.1 Sec-independent protein translocase subunit TatA [Neisseriaceae bacterium]